MAHSPVQDICTKRINALGVGVAQGEGGGGKGGGNFSTDLRGGVLRGDVCHLSLLLRPLEVLLRGPKVPKVHLLKPWKPPYVCACMIL